MIGIYKITSPSKKVYIGQSIHIELRWKRYYKLDCVNQKLLFNSLKKHGIHKHTFEIVEQCDIDMLNDRERFYQDLYWGTKSLNLMLTNTLDKRRILKTNKKSTKNKPFNKHKKDLTEYEKMVIGIKSNPPKRDKHALNYTKIV